MFSGRISGKAVSVDSEISVAVQEEVRRKNKNFKSRVVDKDGGVGRDEKRNHEADARLESGTEARQNGVHRRRIYCVFSDTKESRLREDAPQHELFDFGYQMFLSDAEEPARREFDRRLVSQNAQHER